MVFMTFSLNHFLIFLQIKPKLLKFRFGSFYLVVNGRNLERFTKLKFRLDNRFNLFPGFCLIAISEISRFRVAEREINLQMHW